MILVPCPYCGQRNAAEFRWAGEVRQRPEPQAATPAQWRRYLYMRRNVAGWSNETWFHRAGCGRYFVLERNTVSNEFRAPAATHEPAAEQPEAPPADAAARPQAAK